MDNITVPDDCPRTCPIKTPFELLAQKNNMDIHNINVDVHRLKDNVFGNGREGVITRVERLEMQDKTINEKLNTILVDIDKVKTAAENWKGKVMNALIYLAAGGGGVLGLLELLGK